MKTKIPKGRELVESIGLPYVAPEDIEPLSEETKDSMLFKAIIADVNSGKISVFPGPRPDWPDYRISQETNMACKPKTKKPKGTKKPAPKPKKGY